MPGRAAATEPEASRQVLASSSRLRDATCKAEGCGADFQYVQLFDGMKAPERCGHCQERELRDGPEAPQGQRRDVVELLGRAGVNVDEYSEATLESFDAGEDPQALEAVQAWLQEVRSRRRQRPWLYLHSGTKGCGKTHLAVAALRHLVEAHAASASKVCFRNAEMLLLQIEETYGKGAEDSAYRLVRRYAGYEVLVVDDLGVRGFTDHTYRIFYNLADARAGRPTIWTSNLSLGELESQHREMDRLVSRMLGACGDGARYVVGFQGQDRRAARARCRKEA